MSDRNDLVTVPLGDNPAERASQLLAAAESEGFGPSVVRSDTGDGHRFVVPKSVAQVALGDSDEVEDFSDPWEKDMSTATVSAYPQQGVEAKIGQDESGSDDGDDGSDDGDEKAYGDRLNADLEAEVDKRNEGRSEDDLIKVGGNGNKADLVAALEADDAKAADESLGDSDNGPADPAAPNVEAPQQPTMEQAEQANPVAAQNDTENADK